MAKKPTNEIISDLVTEAFETAELPAQVPAMPIAESAPEVPTPSPANLKVLASFPENSDSANYHAVEAVKSLSQLGVTARVVTGSVFNEANQPVSRLLVELPETVAA